MDTEAARSKVSKLLSLATGAVGGEEARTAAFVAARLIVEYDLLAPPPPVVPTVEAPVEPVPEPRTHDELRPLIQNLLEVMLDLIWQERNNDTVVTVPIVVDWAVETEILYPYERKRGLVMLTRLVQRKRRQGVIVSLRGRYGGYRMAPGVRRKQAVA